jgi:hypothetical protein
MYRICIRIDSSFANDGLYPVANQRGIRYNGYMKQMFYNKQRDPAALDGVPFPGINPCMEDRTENMLFVDFVLRTPRQAGVFTTFPGLKPGWHSCPNGCLDLILRMK